MEILASAKDVLTSSQQMPLGKACHLMVDGFTATPPTDAMVGDFFAEVVNKVGLHIIAGPFFFQLESHQSAFAVIAESHIAITWFPDGLVLMELFSCKPFDAIEMASLVVQVFELEHWEHRVIQRMGVS